MELAGTFSLNNCFFSKEEQNTLLFLLKSNEVLIDKDINATITEKLASMNLEEGKIYIFYVHHNECCDSYDYFCWELVSEEKARKELQKEVSKFEELFNIKY